MTKAFATSTRYLGNLLSILKIAHTYSKEFVEFYNNIDVDDYPHKSDKQRFQETWQEEWSRQKVETDLTTPPPKDRQSKNDQQEFASRWFATLSNSIRCAASSTIPMHKPGPLPDRQISHRTNKLFQERANIHKKGGNKRKIRQIQRKIKKSSLEDYKQWVQNCVVMMGKANKVGDTKKICKLVNKLTNM